MPTHRLEGGKQKKNVAKKYTRDDPTVSFTVDAALLRELGERLVGQPHIALAELVKNAYDADATLCEITFDDDGIRISDNGHGMDKDEFFRFWMRIGTTHKQESGHSRRLRRPVTGSKGVGRLSAQFLAHEIEIITAPDKRSSPQLSAYIDWDKAIQAGELTQAKATYKVRPREHTFAGGSRHGTTIWMGNLKQEWDEAAFTDLAKELWFLQPPVASQYEKIAGEAEDPTIFRVEINGENQEQIAAFKTQMTAALRNWEAKIEGKLERREGKTAATITVRFRGGKKYSQNFELPLEGDDNVGKATISEASWSISVFNLQGRQEYGIPVATARDYFEQFGGVQVYDAGFRLPYYGVKQDWLNIEFDHSHRRNRSALLPAHLHVKRALNDLPTQGRIFGYVSIDTGAEARKATKYQKETGEFLKIQVTRDRLVANKAYLVLRNAVRWSLDYYASRKRLLEEQAARTRRPKEASSEKLVRLATTLQDIKADVPKSAYKDIERELTDYTEAVSRERDADEAARALMAPLATAGMASLAIEHEMQKEMRIGRGLINRLRRHLGQGDHDTLNEIASELSEWLVRLEGVRKVFTPLMSEEDRELVDRLKLRPILEQVIGNIKALLPGINVSISDVADDTLLPPATFAEWHALFQNILVNAANAMLDKIERRINISSGVTGRQRWVHISDTGVGIDIEEAPKLFEPFERQSSISEERKALGLGGMGLGLTIVRMIAESRRCQVKFIEAEAGYASTFQMSWSSS